MIRWWWMWGGRSELSMTVSRNDKSLKPAHTSLSPIFFKLRENFFCYRLGSAFLSLSLAFLSGILFVLSHSYPLLFCLDFLIFFLIILESFLKFSFHQCMGFSAPWIGPFLLLPQVLVDGSFPARASFPLRVLLMTLFLLMPSYIFKWHQNISLKCIFFLSTEV